ncbi:MAG: DUF4215 domain-containing protein [Polyangiales bacterium]
MLNQRLRRPLSALAFLLLVTACGDDDGGTSDGGMSDGAVSDAVSDSSPGIDAPGDPCNGVPAEERCTETQCEGATLAICEANEAGCLVRQDVNCAATTGGHCDPMSRSCLGGECGDVPACRSSSECDGDNLVGCAPDALGCLEETSTDCAATGLECRVSAAGATCVPSSGCNHECDVVGLSCERFAVLTCSENASGCRRLERDACGLGCTEEPTPRCLGDEASECGDSVVEGDETCDDGNAAAGDGCSSFCAVEAGYVCEDGTDCRLSCGDGSVNGDDECDDGGTADGDGCSSSCTVEAGYTCEDTGAGSVCSLSCGNGIREAGDECDDGGNVDGDGCSATCELEAGFTCQGDEPTRCAVNFAVDDGILEDTDEPWTRPTEECGASSTDTVFDSFSYTNTTPDTQRVSVLADFDFDGYLFVFDAAPDGDNPLTACRAGDDDFGDISAARVTAIVVPAGETIHVVISSYESGRGNYSFAIYDSAFACGNDIIEASSGERCDDGNRTDGDGCSAICGVEAGYTCAGEPSTCRLTVCGDGFVEGGEACDDGNEVVDDGCTLCVQDAGYFCSGQPSSCEPQVCGNSIVEAGEVCDHGGIVGADGCAADCFSAVFTGSLNAASPLWDRPGQSCTGSSIGHHYGVFPFEWEGAADASLLWTVEWSGVDGYLHIYDGFDAAMPMDGCLIGNDDAGRRSRSQVRQSIGSGETQEAILSTYEAGDTGDWTLTISR